jgi:hypothetical protein
MIPSARADMPAGLASSTLTSEERIEALLLTIACTLTRQQPHRIAPWLNS